MALKYTTVTASSSYLIPVPTFSQSEISFPGNMVTRLLKDLLALEYNSLNRQDRQTFVEFSQTDSLGVET